MPVGAQPIDGFVRNILKFATASSRQMGCSAPWASMGRRYYKRFENRFHLLWLLKPTPRFSIGLWLRSDMAICSTRPKWKLYCLARWKFCSRRNQSMRGTPRFQRWQHCEGIRANGATICIAFPRRSPKGSSGPAVKRIIFGQNNPWNAVPTMPPTLGDANLRNEVVFPTEY